MKQIKHVEGSAEIFVPVAEKVCKDMPVFFNPVMKFNRDVCICLLQCIGRHLKVGDALAGTGIRAIRIAKEVADCDVFMNDFSHDAFLLMKKNAKRNRVSAVISNKNAHDFLCQGFDYVDIDPFGSPNPFLDSAVRAVRNKGILAITATDTAPLCGTYPKACLRKYWAHTLKNPAMHETGIRILIRKVQLIGSQYDRALIPVFSHSTQHYFRVYFRLEKGKNDVDEVLRSHELVRFGNKIIGPLWTGQLWDSALSKRMAEKNAELQVFAEESKVPVVGFFSTHELASKHAVSIPAIEKIISVLRKKRYFASRTHFSGKGIRTNAPSSVIVSVMKGLSVSKNV